MSRGRVLQTYDSDASPYRTAGATIDISEDYTYVINKMKNLSAFIPCCLVLPLFAAVAQQLRLPPRSSDAPGGTAFIQSSRDLPRIEREERMFRQVTAGNVPDFLRRLVPVTVATPDSEERLTYFVIPDYLGIGNDTDYCLVPMTPALAQRIADTTRCSLPTRKMVDDIFRESRLQLRPQPIPPDAEMTGVPRFVAHNDSVWHQRAGFLSDFPPGVLVSGDKKDIIISNSIYTNLKPGVPLPVVIYGWHRPDGSPIQPLYNGHGAGYADYSHGVRLVQQTMFLNGKAVEIDSLLSDPALSRLLSDEGLIRIPRYPTGETARSR